MSAQTLGYAGRALEVRADETVLDCLERHKIPMASSCRSGVCQSCLLQAKSAPPASAQRGLKESDRARNYFLACQCRADVGVEVLRAEDIPSRVTKVRSVNTLAPGVLQVLLDNPSGFEFQSGQFLNLVRSDGLTRPYSIASLPDRDHLELHIAAVPGGLMSGYLEAAQGKPMAVRGPAGECFYLPEFSQQPLLLIGTGTGLAPLVGIVRSALSGRHRGPIFLYHGAARARGLYLREHLAQLAREHATLNYRESVLQPPTSEELAELPGREVLHVPSAASLYEQIKADHPQISDYRVYLCGQPEFVRQMKKQCFLAGAPMNAIHSDPFLRSPALP